MRIKENHRFGQHVQKLKTNKQKEYGKDSISSFKETIHDTFTFNSFMHLLKCSGSNNYIKLFNKTIKEYIKFSTIIEIVIKNIDLFDTFLRYRNMKYIAGKIKFLNYLPALVFVGYGALGL